jgi:hypothetical protein
VLSKDYIGIFDLLYYGKNPPSRSQLKETYPGNKSRAHGLAFTDELNFAPPETMK